MEDKKYPIKWEYKSHSYQIGDTGDYDGYWEVTNGRDSIITKDDYEDIEKDLQQLVDLLNNTYANFKVDRGNEAALEAENKLLIHELEELRKAQPGPRWVKGDYERLYDQLKANPEKKVACFVDYYWDRDKTKGPLRDICAVRGNTLEFNARGIGYGGAPSWFDEVDKKEAFLDECVRLNVEWLDEQPAAVWVKGTCNFPIKKPVIAKKFISYLNKEVIGTASSATGEMICFDWGGSSVCLAIGHEELNDLYWLDESAPAAGREEDNAVAFAEWAIREEWNTSHDGKGWMKHSDETPYVLTTAELYELFKQQKEK